MSDQSSILLVEDDPAARRLFAEAIDESTKVDLKMATDGSEALQILPQRNGETRSVPDLIVLDLDLPKIDGIDVLRELKANNSPARRIPILILSGVTDQAVIDEAYELGANAFLPKPDDYDDLLTLVREISDFWFTYVVHPSD